MPAPVMQHVLDRCRDAMFTGILRVRSKQAEAEIWFLSGILEWVKFGVSVGDEAMTRLLAATSAKVEVVPCLPSPAGGFRKRATAASLPLEGRLSDTRPVDLLRFCETHAITCRVELVSGASRGEAVYRLGELIQIRCEQAGAANAERAVAAMLDWSDGHYLVVLPTIELPEGVEARSTERDEPAKEEAEQPAESEAQAWRKAMNEAVKRKAEAVVAKLGPASEVALLSPAIEAKVALDPVPEPPKPKGKAKAPNKSRARPVAVVVRVQRVRTDEADIRVPLTDDLLLPAAEDGSRAIDVEKLFAAAAKLSKRATVKWRYEGSRVQVHPMQAPPEVPQAARKK